MREIALVSRGGVYVSPLANIPSHVSHNTILTSITSPRRVIPTPVVYHYGEIPERMASYPPAGWYPHAGPIPYGSNKFPSAAAIFNYVTYDQAALPTPLGLPTQKLNETILQPLSYRPYTELVKNGQTTILEKLEIAQTPEQRQEILGAKEAIFNRTFNTLRDSRSTNKSDVSSLGKRRLLSSSKVSMSSSKTPPNSTSISIDISSYPDVEEAERDKFHQKAVATSDSTAIHSEKEIYNQYRTNAFGDEEDAKHERYLQQIAAGTGQAEKDLHNQYRHNTLGDHEYFRDREKLYPLTDLIDRNNSERSSEVTLHRSSDLLRMSVNSSNFATNYGRESSKEAGRDINREISMGTWNSGDSHTFLNNELDLNFPEIMLTDAQEVIEDWKNSKQSSSGSLDPKINIR